MLNRVSITHSERRQQVERLGDVDAPADGSNDRRLVGLVEEARPGGVLGRDEDQRSRGPGCSASTRSGRAASCSGWRAGCVENGTSVTNRRKARLIHV